MNYGGQTWSGGGGGGYDQGMGGINQSGPQEGDPQAMRWAQQNNPQLYAQYQQDKFAREQEQKKNPPWMGWANRLNDPAQKPGMGTKPGSQFIGGPPQQQPQQGQGNWSSPYSTANSGWGGPSGGQPQSPWGGGTQQQGYQGPSSYAGGQGGMGGGQIAGLMNSMYGRGTGQGGGSQGYGGWGGLQTNQAWR